MNIWISMTARKKAVDYATEHYPYEAGGTLIGYCTADGQNVVVTELLPPGPNAYHGRFSYTPDYEWDRKTVGDAYDNANGYEYYLGDWHSHPQGVAALSWRDKIALGNIAKFRDNYMDSPVMLILAIDDVSNDLKGWRISRQFPHLSFWTYKQLNVIIH